MENALLGVSLGKTIVFVIISFSSLPNCAQHSNGIYLEASLFILNFKYLKTTWHFRELLLSP